jgi:hypothetical protein
MALYKILIPFLIFIVVEFYFYKGIKPLLKSSVSKITYYLISIFGVIIFLVGIFKPFILWPKWLGVYVVGVFFILLVSKTIGCIVLLIFDCIRFIKRYLIPFTLNKGTVYKQTNTLTRKEFINKLTFYSASVPFIGLLYGMIKTAFDYKVHRIRLTFSHLPEAFNGFKIIQISDIHSGTYVNQGPLETAINLINKEQGDIIFFTGDLVNEIAAEAFVYKEQLSALKAPFGVYSILGNHDYGDYFRWNSDKEKQMNLQALKDFQKSCGWDLLLNESRIIEKNNQKIAIIGVENWGSALRFPKLGDVDKAKKGTEHIPFKILLSHDPSHWDAKVVGYHSDIDLMLSGHTHGMQLGVEIKGFKWSPSKYFYKQWAGLYKQSHQYLYVNRGLGVIGYPGRLGILPEITVIELYKA